LLQFAHRIPSGPKPQKPFIIETSLQHRVAGKPRRAQVMAIADTTLNRRARSKSISPPAAIVFHRKAARPATAVKIQNLALGREPFGSN
jgi:hypothetical protein